MNVRRADVLCCQKLTWMVNRGIVRIRWPSQTIACLIVLFSTAVIALAQVSSRQTLVIAEPQTLFWKWWSNSCYMGADIDIYVHNNRASRDVNDRYRIDETVHIVRTHPYMHASTYDNYPGQMTELDDPVTPPFAPEAGAFVVRKTWICGAWQGGKQPAKDQFQIYRHSTVVLSFKAAGTTQWVQVDAADLIIDLGVYADYVKPSPEYYYTSTAPRALHLYLNGGTDEQDCDECQGTCPIAKPEPQLENGQASVIAGLGTDELGRSGSLVVNLGGTPGSTSFLSSDSVGGNGTGLEYTKDGSGKTTRITGGQAVVQVIDSAPSSPGFELKMYHSAAEADAGTVAFGSLQFSYASNQVSVSETYLGTSRSYSFSYDTNSHLWSLQHGDEDWVVDSSSTGDSATDSSFDRVETKRTLAGEVISKTKYSFNRSNGVSRLVKVVRDPDGRNIATDYEYDSNGLVSYVRPDDGPWQEHTYDSNHLLTKRRTQFGNAPRTAADSAVQVITKDYNPAGPPTRLTVETLLGQEVRRVYRVDLAGGYDRIVATVPGAAWDAATNLKTSHRFYTQGEFFGKPLSITFPDGTSTLYTYTRDSGTGTITTVKETGVPHATNPGVIVDGVRITTVTGAGGQVLARTRTDVASGLTLSEETTLSWDAFGRPAQTRTLAGTESRGYGCCGLDSFADVTGLIRIFTKNGPVRTERHQGITWTKTRTGRIVTVKRKGTDNSVIETARTERNLASELVRWVDAGGRETLRSEQINSQSGYRTITLTYPDGGVRVETYFPDGRLQSIGGTATYPERYEYGVENNLRTTKVISIGNGGEDAAWRKTYVDMAGRLLREGVSHERGTPAGIQYAYNSKGQLERVVDADGVAVLFAYDAKGELVTQAVDANGNGLIDLDGADRVVQWERTYAQRDGKTVRRVSRKELQSPGSSAATTVSVTEEAVNGLQSWSSVGGVSRSAETTLQGDGAGTIVGVFPDGSRWVRQIVGGFVTGERFEESTGIAVEHTAYGYDAHGRLAWERDGRSATTSYSYFDDDRLQSVTAPDPGDGSGAQVTRYTYDSKGRLDTVTLPDTGVVDRDYFPTGDLRRRSGARTWPVDFTYDSQGRMATMTTEGGVTAWSYHPESGRLKAKTHGDGHGSSYTYTAAGRIDTKTNGRGTVSAYHYNVLGDVALVDYADATPDEGYTYTRHGLLAAAAVGNRTSSYVYSAAGEMESESVSENLLNGLIVDPSYDSLGRRRTWRAAGPGWEVATGYGYDAASRLSSVTSRNREIRYSYLANSSLLESTAFLTGGAEVMETSRAWDNRGRLQCIDHQSAGSAGVNGLHQSFSYLYNLAGQRSRLTREDGGYWNFEYDTRGQISAAKERLQDGTPRAGRQFEYEFDGIGNRTAVRIGGDGAGQDLRLRQYTKRTGDGTQISTVEDPGTAVITGWANPAASVLIDGVPAQSRQGNWFRHEMSLGNSSGAVEASVRVEAKLNGKTESDVRSAFVRPAQSVFEYDQSGNLTFDGYLEYTWDANDRLKQVGVRSGLAPPGSTAGDFRQEMEYDHLGRRIRRTLYYRIDGQMRLASDIAYVYDGWNLAAEVDARNGALLRSYVWGLDLSGSTGGAGGVGGLLSVTDVRLGQTHYAVCDGNGNLTGCVNALNGELSAAYYYDPFGNSLGTSGKFAARNPFRFSSKYFDEAPGLYEYGFRNYDPRHGRWLSRDPLGEQGGTNLYGFVGNEPVGWVDDLGARPDGFSTQQIDSAVDDLLSGKVPDLLGFNPLEEQRLQANGAAHVALVAGDTAVQLASPDPTDVAVVAGAWGLKGILGKLPKLDELWRGMRGWFKGGEKSILSEETVLDAALDASKKCKAPLLLTYDPDIVSYQSGVIRAFATDKNEVYYRVYSGDRTAGAFLTKMKPKSSAWAREALALPPSNKAEFIQQVRVPSGTYLVRSRAAPNVWGRGGAEQFEIIKLLPNQFQPVGFGTGIPFE